MSDMYRLGVLALCVPALLISACRSVSVPRNYSEVDPRPKPIPHAVPLYGWSTLTANKVEFQALNGEQFTIPNHAKIRVTVDADSGVFGGVFYKQLLEAQLRERPTLRQADFSDSACALIGVVQGEVECSVDSPADLVYVLRDKRSELAVLGGTLLALRGSAGALERASAPNRVAVTIDVWRCVANCPFKSGGAIGSSEIDAAPRTVSDSAEDQQER